MLELEDMLPLEMEVELDAPDMSELEVTLPNGMLIDGEVGALLEAELPTPPFRPVPGTPILAPPWALLPWDWLPPPPV
jgi:hypothetical protein